ncbi:MAG: protease modulator HflK, partial [Tateyamaria sp.]
LAPILNRDRGIIADEAEQLIQGTLNAYDSGVNIVRLLLDKADPPREVIDSFREVQAAEQERDRLERQADAYANRVTAGARGEAASQLEQAEAYRAQQVNEAEGEAARFTSVLEEYTKAPGVTRKRLYLETMEKVFGDVDKIILESDLGGNGGQGVVPYLPLNELRRGGTN